MKIKLKIMIGIFATLLCSAVPLRVYADSTELHKAVINGDMYEIERLCEEHPSWVEEGDDEGKTPLHIAAFKGNLPAVRYLIDVMHVDVNQKNKSPKLKVLTSLYYAIYSGNLDLIKYLVSSGVKVINEEGMHTFDALPIAMRAGFKPIVEYFVNNVSFPEGSVNCDSLLYHAVRSKKLEMVKYAVEVLHANVNATDPRGNTCLQWAVSLELGDIIEYLVAHGADVTQVCFPRTTSLHTMVRCGNLDFVKQWMRIPNLPNPPVSQLNEKDDMGRTPLYYAVRSGNLDMVKYLAESCHVSLLATDNEEKSFLHVAMEQGHRDVVGYLFGRYAPIGGESTDGKTLLSLALEKGYTDIVEYLMARNITVKTADISKKTPLHIALEKGLFSIAKSLVARGADVNAVDNMGVTPLSLAIDAGDFDMVKCLVEHRADVNLKIGDIEPPIFRTVGALGSRRFDIFNYLVQKGANIFETDCYGKSLMYNAQLYHDRDMVEHLKKYGMVEEILVSEFGGEEFFRGDPFRVDLFGESSPKRGRFEIFGDED